MPLRRRLAQQCAVLRTDQQAGEDNQRQVEARQLAD